MSRSVAPQLAGEGGTPHRPFVQLIQPVVPQYRLPVFDRLYERLGGRLRVSACLKVYGCPDSVTVHRDYLDLDHRCSSLRRWQLHWQHGMTLDPRIGAADVLMVNGNPRFLSTLGVARAARQRGAGLVVWTQAWSPTSAAWRARLRHSFAGAADAVLVYAESELPLMRSQLPAGMPVFAAGNAIDLAPIDAARAAWTPARLEEFRRAQGLGPEPLLLFVGRLRAHPPSELSIALDALAALRSTQGRVCRLAIVGEGPERERLVALARQLGVSDQITWLGAIYDENRIAPWFLSAAALVYPGSVGLSLLHAMAYGLPVVTHGELARQNPEIEALLPGENGLLYAHGDARDLAARVAQLLDDDPARQRMGRAARVRVETRYTLDGMVDHMLEAIEAASAAARRPGR